MDVGRCSTSNDLSTDIVDSCNELDRCKSARAEKCALKINIGVLSLDYEDK